MAPVLFTCAPRHNADGTGGRDGPAWADMRLAGEMPAPVLPGSAGVWTLCCRRRCPSRAPPAARPPRRSCPCRHCPSRRSAPRRCCCSGCCRCHMKANCASTLTAHVISHGICLHVMTGCATCERYPPAAVPAGAAAAEERCCPAARGVWCRGLHAARLTKILLPVTECLGSGE